MISAERSLTSVHISDLSEFISRKIGLNFPEDRWRDLVRGVQAASCEFGFPNVEECVEWLLSTPLTKEETEILASYLTVGETYFFRDEKLFEEVEHHVLRPLIEERRTGGRCLRIWSAGCASGEEAYSIAILLKKMIFDPENWRIKILATDINPHFLRKAREGIYSEWSFRGTPAWLRDRYFSRSSDGRWKIMTDIKRMVEFVHHNLAEILHPLPQSNTEGMDIIFCRNVLMYFTPEMAESVVKGFFKCLNKSGWLIISPYEAPVALFSEFKPVRFPEAILYQKESEDIDMNKSTVVHVLRTPPRGKMRAGVMRGRKAEISPIPLPRDGASEVQHNHERTGLPLNYDKCSPMNNPEIAEAAYNLANVGMLAQAREFCKMAISKNHFNASLRYLLAAILQEEGKVDDAVQTLKQVLYLNQDFVLAHFALGYLANVQGKYKDAEKHFENALLLLRKFQKDDVLPGTNGMTAGALTEMIVSSRRKENNGRHS